MKINCLIVDDEPIAREILESYIAKVSQINLVKSCQNALEAFNALNSYKIDLILLDINMPEISGLQLAKVITKNSKIIFTTAYREYALDGFDLQAVDYLLKPISLDRFLKAINKYFDITAYKNIVKTVVASSDRNDFIFIRSDRKMIKIKFNTLLYVESLSDYIKIFTDNTVLITRETMTNIEAKLPQVAFIRIHRSYLVSINKIKSYTNEYIEIGNKALPLSRTYKTLVLKRLEKY